jgi:II/X family phage/plasmid replication protein
MICGKMIDWTRVLIPVLHRPINSGSVMSVNPDGDIEWISPKRVPVRGSYESSIIVRSQGGDGRGNATHLYIDGNPSKFIQGQNIFTSNDLNGLLEETLSRVGVALRFPTRIASARVRRGDYEVLGLHLARLFDAGSNQRVEQIQSALALKSRTRRGRCQTIGYTNYWNKSKRKNRWLIKSYGKHKEIVSGGKGHSLPEEIPCRDELIQAANGMLRIELEIYKQELKEKDLVYGRDFTEEVLESLYQEYWERISMSTQAVITSQEIDLMPRCLQSSYLLWKEGIDVRSRMSEPTFYRHRKEILEYGVDIAIPNEMTEQSNVIPLFQTIEAKPVSNPQWAYDAGLIFQ